ncbi:hypothetical protein FB45DRAFT_980455 [Roridomyces roridus]|uniref:F-box domain-containing protein n=1 Tax=Roridomyces roridus TaxID=1738132 RepID=A0AAD7BKC4_9AGAR|nr:hypothetical protein FB45DRAFT_980455 [Roridomyces roridus]
MAPVLPTDVLILVLRHLGIRDVLQFRQTCKEFREITQLRSVWYHLLQSQVLEQNIPIPQLQGRSLTNLDTTELELCLQRALRLRQNWTSPSTMSIRRLTFRTVPEPRSQVVSLAFLPGRGHRWLMSLVLSTPPGHRAFTLQCWDLLGNPSTCVARRCPADFRGFRINTDASYPGIVALRSPIGVEIMGIDFTANDPESAFVTIQQLDFTESLHTFAGSTLLTKFDDNRLNLRVLENPDSSVELQNPSHTQQKECVDALVTETYAIVVRTTTLELYSLSPFRSGSSSPVLEPIQTHTWQWRVDSVCMVPQPSYTATSRGVPPPLNILVRYASLFPWPVNALHHYVLPCNPSYDALVPLEEVNNLPYLRDPVLLRTFASPIRLFARWDMVLGSHGTALWIDSHTEDYFDHAVEGQRLAGTLFTNVDVDEPVLPLSDQGVAATASMVYDVREDDRWVRIAIEEEEGKIAVGSSTAEITVYEYI